MKVALVCFSMDSGIVHSTIVKVSTAFLDHFSSFSFHLHSLISSIVALAIAFDCIMFKYSSKVTTCDMMESINGYFLLVCLAGKCGSTKRL
jgi:hypothetical protein